MKIMKTLNVKGRIRIHQLKDINLKDQRGQNGNQRYSRNILQSTLLANKQRASNCNHNTHR